MYHWYALYVKARNEKKVTALLVQNGYTAYLPLVKTVRQWSDRKKRVEVPLIASYVFVKVSELEYYDILNTPGVVRYVTFEGKAAPIRESEIETLRRALEGNLPVELMHESLVPGRPVKIISGPLKGAEGEYVATKNKSNLIINLSQVGFFITIEINASDVRFK